MELRRYLKIVRRWKWLAAAAFVITSLAAAAFVLPQRPIYESSGTWLIRSDIPGDVGNAIDAANALSQNVNIATSYATVARSDMIRRRAIETLGLSVDTADTKVDAEVLTGTNVLSISVRGPDPSVDRDLAQAVGQQLVAYVVSIRDPYAIDQIDAPKVSRTPIAPNKKLTIGLGVVLGFMLGIGLALLAEYLSEGARSEKGESYGGLGLDSLLRVRLRQEMTRTDRSGQPFTVGLLKISQGDRNGSDEPDEPDHVPTPGDVRRVEELLRLAVPDRAVVSYLGAGDFGAILPGTPRHEAVELLGRLTEGISSLLERDGSGQATVSLWTGGACEYADGRFVGDSTTTGAIKRLMGGNAPVDRSVAGVAGSRSATNGKSASSLVGPGESAESHEEGGRSDGPTPAAARDPARASLLSRKLSETGAPEPSRAQIGAPEPSRAQTGGPEPSRAQTGGPEPSRAQTGAPAEPSRAQTGAPEPSRAHSEAAAGEAGTDASKAEVGADPPIVRVDAPREPLVVLGDHANTPSGDGTASGQPPSLPRSARRNGAAWKGKTRAGDRKR